MSSTALPPQADADLAPSAKVAAVEKEILKHSRLSLLGRMAGVKSIARNLKSEDCAVARDIERGEREIYGDRGPAASNPEEENPMDIMAAGNVRVNLTQPAAPAQKLASTLMPLALGALLATTGIGAIGTAVALPMLIDALKQKPTQPPTQQPPVQNPPSQNPPANGSSHTYQGRANIRVGEPTITPPPGG